MLTLAKELLRTVSAAKTVDAPVLNRLGLQPARAIAARSLAVMRRKTPHPSVADYLLELEQNGFVEIRDFLPADAFARLREEALAALESNVSRSVHDHGACSVEQVLVRNLDPSENPALAAFVSNHLLVRLFSAAQRRDVDFRRGHASVERLTVHNTLEADQESALHVDTFFDTYKCWLYLDDVNERSSPFVYVPRSQQLSAKRLRRIYRESVGDNNGSRRISPEELAESGLEERVFHSPANTLLLANTFGFHRRQTGPLGSTRLALHVSVRQNPFLPPRLDSWVTATRLRLRPQRRPTT